MSDEEQRKIFGVIQSRRCLGKHLSFATLADVNQDLIKVVFRRHNFEGGNGETSNFPTKTSDLAYGASVEMQVVDTGADLLEVRSWTIVGEHPRTQALHVAQASNGGVSCKKYLQSRAETFRGLHGNALHGCSFSGSEPVKRRDRVDTPTANDASEDVVHGNVRTSGLRARIFAKWLVETMPTLQHVTTAPTSLPAILDVAGGKGLLSVELIKLGIPCTVIDPLIRSKRALRRLDKSRKNLSAVNVPAFVAARFDQEKETNRLVVNYSCLVGFHPDECTEDIVDVALRQSKPFAVVPCCVFPSFFPLRKLASGRFVHSYTDFLEYLLEKDTRLKRATLPFEGKNQVIYLKRQD